MLLQPITLPFSKSTLKPSVYTLKQMNHHIDAPHFRMHTAVLSAEYRRKRRLRDYQPITTEWSLYPEVMNLIFRLW